ncbi:MAG: peroxiredoxin family protein [Candidatus Aminicenantia bacterium]
MKRNKLIIVNLFILAFVLCGQAEKTFAPAPDFTLPDITGKKISLSDYQGKIIILDFWATWCPPCRIEIPAFIELYNKYKQQGLVIIGISLDREGTKVLIPFIKKYGINYPILLGNKEVVKAYGGIRGIPTTFIIDQRGKIRNKHIGVPPNFKEVFKNEFLSLKEES